MKSKRFDLKLQKNSAALIAKPLRQLEPHVELFYQLDDCSQDSNFSNQTFSFKMGCLGNVLILKYYQNSQCYFIQVCAA